MKKKVLGFPLWLLLGVLLIVAYFMNWGGLKGRVYCWMNKCSFDPNMDYTKSPPICKPGFTMGANGIAVPAAGITN